ncbi:MAG: type II restriction endonuclease [Thermoanaerobaculia bacterium]|nr:type II restriction endonuclease [Thermoanaerobaculia bacterium]
MNDAQASQDPLRALITRWRQDPRGTFQSWFLWEERLKNFRSIRRGLQVVVAEIDSGRFGNVYKGSSLETVVGSIAEQRQIFKGADHAFLWKPKLRIPDIYESTENQRAFGHFLQTCACCDGEQQVVAAIRQLDAQRIKGLGPAAANLLYFLHPVLVPPFNTAIVNGYNSVTGSKVKLGRWIDFLAMREGILTLNARYRDLLSNDLGAIGGFLFDIGAGRYVAPPRDGDDASLARWETDLARVREESVAQAKALQKAREGDTTHTEVQGWLRDLGSALGFEVWVAANDRGRAYEAGTLADGCRTELPAQFAASPAADTVRLIDVLWLDRASGRAEAAFEVEHTTSIYSGIVRMLDLALGFDSGNHAAGAYFLVAPDDREDEVRAQLARPAFSRVRDLALSYLPYSALRQHREAIARFGSGLKAVRAVAKPLS